MTSKPEVIAAQGAAIARRLIESWIKEEAAIQQEIQEAQERLAWIRSKKRELEKAYPVKPDPQTQPANGPTSVWDPHGRYNDFARAIDAFLAESEGMTSEDVRGRLAIQFPPGPSIHVVRGILSDKQKEMGWYPERRGKGSVWRKASSAPAPAPSLTPLIPEAASA